MSALRDIGRALSGRGINTLMHVGITEEGDAWALFADKDGRSVAHIARTGSTNVLVWSDGTTGSAPSLTKFVDALGANVERGRVLHLRR